MANASRDAVSDALAELTYYFDQSEAAMGFGAIRYEPQTTTTTEPDACMTSARLQATQRHRAIRTTFAHLAPADQRLLRLAFEPRQWPVQMGHELRHRGVPMVLLALETKAFAHAFRAVIFARVRMLLYVAPTEAVPEVVAERMLAAHLERARRLRLREGALDVLASLCADSKRIAPVQREAATRFDRALEAYAREMHQRDRACLAVRTRQFRTLMGGT